MYTDPYAAGALVLDSTRMTALQLTRRVAMRSFETASGILAEDCDRSTSRTTRLRFKANHQKLFISKSTRSRYCTVSASSHARVSAFMTALIIDSRHALFLFYAHLAHTPSNVRQNNECAYTNLEYPRRPFLLFE